jgi:branched-chain amino acid aminotransferase
MDPGKSIWLDGRLVPWKDANFHFFTHTLHYGVGVFEGLRCYKQERGASAIFRLREHVRRLFDSARACFLHIPFEPAAIEAACIEVVRDNGYDECYLRPLVWMGEGPMGLGSTKNKVRVGIGAFPWGPYLGKDVSETGIRCAVAPLERLSARAHLPKAKISGQYVNSILANRQATLAGYDEALLLDSQGRVAEGSGENVFCLRRGLLLTPGLDAPILEGITRDTILVLARERAKDLGIEVREQSFTRDDLYLADEAFLTGTAAEVTPVREVDGRAIGSGKVGPVTKALMAAYRDAVRGRDARHREWLAPIGPA